MNGILDNYFALDSSTLQAKNKRLELISENIANTSTLGFQARDLDFGEFIENAQNLISEDLPLLTQTTSTWEMTILNLKINHVSSAPY